MFEKLLSIFGEIPAIATAFIGVLASLNIAQLVVIIKLAIGKAKEFRKAVFFEGRADGLDTANNRQSETIRSALRISMEAAVKKKGKADD